VAQRGKHKKLLTILKGWIRAGKRGTTGIPFTKFESTIVIIRHAFICIPAGVGLLSPCNQLLQKRPSYIYLHKNNNILTALEGCQTLLQESTLEPIKCRELICGWPDYEGIVNASGHGIGGVIFGETLMCTPTVFWWEWPKDIKNNIITLQNPEGKISNSDLKMAGLLMLWLVIEGVCKDLCKKCVTLFSNNLPTVGWVRQLASKRSIIAENLIQALALRLKTLHACPLTPMHIEGKQNAISDMPSRSFGSKPKWTCKTNEDLLTIFNSMFPLQMQKFWMVYCRNCAVATRMISILQMKLFALDKWRQLPKVGRHVGNIGAHMSDQWEWIYTYSRYPLAKQSNASQALQPQPEQDTMETDNRCKEALSLTRSRPLSRQFPWPATTTQQR
jgi:hypothetical protein